MSIEEVTKLVTDWSSMDNRLVAERKEDGKVVGSVGYWIDENGTYSIDYDFNPDYGKKGYATEAATELLRYLFEELQLPEIYGDCDTKNANSYQLLERLGFQRIKQIDNTSYKNDVRGNPILISTYLYQKKNQRENLE